MAIGMGPGSDMVRSVDKMRKNSKRRSLKDSSSSTSTGKTNDPGLKFKETDPRVMAEIKAKMAKEKKRNRMISLVLGGLVVLAALYVLIFVRVVG